jgi:hypothetical protein
VVVRSPQQFVLDQLVTARVFAEGWELITRKDAFQIPHFSLPSGARPVQLIAQFMQRHPLHRFVHNSERLT